MPKVKASQKKIPAKSGRKPAKVVVSKAVVVKHLSAPHVKKDVSRIKKVRALQEGFAQVMTSKPEKLENHPVLNIEAPVAKKPQAKKQAAAHKGLLNKVCFSVGALLSDGNALLSFGKK